MQTTTAPAYAVGSDGESQHKGKKVPKLRKLGVLSFARFQAALTALLGVLAGLVYSVGGAIYDLLTIGLNLGTALAFLALIGMPLAFSELAADFSGMNGQAPPSQDSLFLSSVFHQAHLEVNEEGTEAAAATAANLLTRAALGPSIPPNIPVFRADHPFLFAIRDRKSGQILFLGRVSDPTLHQSSR